LATNNANIKTVVKTYKKLNTSSVQKMQIQIQNRTVKKVFKKSLKLTDSFPKFYRFLSKSPWFWRDFRKPSPLCCCRFELQRYVCCLKSRTNLLYSAMTILRLCQIWPLKYGNNVATNLNISYRTWRKSGKWES